jgi:hypothetical protein
MTDMERSHVKIEPFLGKCNWELAYNMVEIDLPSVMISDFVNQLGQSNPTQHNIVYTISSLLISTKRTYCTLALNQVLVVECTWTPKLAVRGAVHKKKCSNSKVRGKNELH